MKQFVGMLYLTLLALSACGGQVETPTALKLYLGGSIWGPTYSVELRDGVLHYVERDNGKENTATIVPSPEQWAKFRKALDACDVWSWRRMNSHELDQRHWTVSIAYKGTRVDRSGYGKCPGRTPTGFGGTVEFNNFQKAVRSLLGGKAFE
jgi:hypothetical protein